MFAADLVRELGRDGVTQHVAVLDSRGASVAFDAPVTAFEMGIKRVPPFRVDLGVVRDLRRLIAHWSPDLVQGHGGDTLKYSVLASVGKGSPVLHRAIGMAPPSIRRGPRRVAYRMLMERTAFVLPLAQAVADEIIEVFGLSHKKVVMIPNAVDVRRIEPRRGKRETRSQLAIPPRAPVVLSLAALTWEKDPLAHLEVMGRVLKAVPRAVHLIAGDGPMRPEVQAAIWDRGLNGRVHLLGVREDVADLLAASDVLLFASRSDGMEGLPTILVEAGMARRPVVAYGIAGVNEVIQSDVTGLLAEPGHPARLAQLVSSLLQDPRRRRAIGEAARRRCISTFEIQPVARRYQEIYTQIVGQKGSSPLLTEEPASLEPA